MRRLLLIGLAAITTLPVFAAHRISVSQLEQSLATAVAKHRSDADLAHQLGNLALSERLTTRTLDDLLTKFALQPHAALALELLADESALLELPRGELPATAAPDVATQQQILAAARAYVAETIPRLPNFFATRGTVRFDDSAQVLHAGEWPIRAGFHLVGNTARTVTVRDGREVTDSAKEVAAQPEQIMGLYSFGEFGPILARTLTDLAKGKIQFSHWEDSKLGVVAVFRYSVPKHESHYEVHFCCILDQEYQGGPSYHNRNLPRYHSGDPNPVETKGLKAYDATPPYHGTLAIDPATGAIARMTLDAELDPDNPIMRASTVVEYGRVTIGDESFVCPVRSLAISSQQGPPPTATDPERAPIVSINETTFNQYHRLGSSARLIADGSVPATAVPTHPGDTQSTTNANRAAVSDTGSATQPAPVEASTAAAEQPSLKTAADPPAGVPITPTTPAPVAEATAAATTATDPAAPADPPQPEISTAEASDLPDVPAHTPPPQEGSSSLTLTSRLVDVGVLAFDKKGRPVTDLKPQDFELLDDGHKQEVRFFTPVGAQEQGAAIPAADSATRSFSNRVKDPSGDAVSAAEIDSGGTILLMDETHIPWNDLNYARGQMLKFLSSLPAGERVGLYAMTGLGFRVLVDLTSDHSVVAAKLRAFLPSAQSLNEAQQEERRYRQQFAAVHNPADLNTVNGSRADLPDAEQSIDPELMSLGSNPARASLIILAQVARHLAAIPGHKTLVWISSDNVLAGSRDQAAGADKDANTIEGIALRAREGMNDAHASVYPVDVSQWQGGVASDSQHSSMDLAAAAAQAAASAASAGAAGASGSARDSSRDTGVGSVSAQMTQDLHPIQGAVREVADGTGGRAIQRAADLAAALSGIVQDGRAAYELSFSPQTAADDRYHTITVKLTGRHGVTLRYRTGYVFDKEPATLKDRFQQAVWRPADTSGIGVTAGVAPGAGGNSLSVKIAGSDLAMEQQGGRWMDKLDIFFVQRDDVGIRAHLDGQTLGLRLKPETYQNAIGSGIPIEHTVQMQPGMTSVRVLVVDENSGRMGSVTIPSSALQAAR